MRALGVFGGALEFIVDERQLLFEKTLEHVILSGAAIAIALAIAIPLGVWLGHLHRGSLARDQRRERRAGTAEPGRDRRGARLPPLRVLAGARRARHRRRAADPHERVRRGRRGRAGGRRGGQGHGHDARGRSCAASSCRSHCRCSSQASGPRPSSSSPPPRSPPSPAGAGSARSCSIRRATGPKVWSGAAIVVSLLALAADALFGALQRALTPRGLQEKVPAFEPDVMSAGTAGAR